MELGRVANGVGEMKIERWAPRDIRARVRCETDCTFVFHQFYYPGWQARGFAVDASEGGLVRVTASRGEYEMRLRLDGGSMEAVGRWVTALCVLGLLAFGLTEARV